MTIGAPRGPAPPVVFVSFVAAATGLAVLLPTPAGWGAPARVAGLALVAGGAALHAAAWRRFGEAGTPVDTLAEPRILVTDGPYARTRNPMYLAGVVILCGWALALGCPAALVLAPTFARVARVRWIAPEEHLLRRRLGEGWEAYARRIRRWI